MKYISIYVYLKFLVLRLAATVTSTNTRLARVTGSVSSQDVVRYGTGEGGGRAEAQRT